MLALAACGIAVCLERSMFICGMLSVLPAIWRFLECAGSVPKSAARPAAEKIGVAVPGHCSLQVLYHFAAGS